MTLGDLFLFSNLVLISKGLIGQAPQVFSDLLVPLRSTSSETRGADSGNYKVPLIKTCLGQTSVSVRGVNVWIYRFETYIQLEPF